MEWNAANEPVAFKQYDGAFTLDNLPPTPSTLPWTSASDQNPFIPATNCEQFHLNFWMGNYPEADSKGYNPPPASPQELVVTNFLFRPKQP